MTALHMALMRGGQNVVQLLLIHNASIHHRDIHGRTALYFALIGQASEILDQFWSLTANSDDLDKHGRSYLHHAAAYGCVQETLRLLTDGFDPHSTDKDGWTPMHWAARSGAVSIINILKDAGADENAVSAHGWTPRTVAVYHHKDSILVFLHTRNSGHSMKQVGVDDTSQEVRGHHFKDTLCDGCYLVRQLSYGTHFRRVLIHVKGDIRSSLQVSFRSWVLYQLLFQMLWPLKGGESSASL